LAEDRGAYIVTDFSQIFSELYKCTYLFTYLLTHRNKNTAKVQKAPRNKDQGHQNPITISFAIKRVPNDIKKLRINRIKI